MVFPIHFRYIDDIICNCRVDPFQVLDTWHQQIRVKCTGTAACAYLDLFVQYKGDRLHYKLYRKEQNLYLYVPRCSAHHPKTFSAVVTGEATRTLRRCLDPSDAQRELQFLLQKLILRGYNKSHVERLIAKAQDKHLGTRRRQSSDRPLVKKHFLKIQYSAGFDGSWFVDCVARHKTLLQRVLPDRSIGLAFSTAPNNFLRNYARTWRPPAQ